MNTARWKNATPEQINLWNIASGLIAWNTITPLYFQGAPAGSEFLTYNAAKLYICLEFKFGFSGQAAGLNDTNVYDEANAINFNFANSIPFWDATAAAPRYLITPWEFKNFYFSRISAGSYLFIIFNGYRLTTV